MSDKATLSELKKIRDDFLYLDTTDDLAALLNVNPFVLQAAALDPQYHVFHRPKKDGSMRLIENPQKPLKGIQRKLNKYLQAIYFFEKTEAAYGFMIHCAGDKARQHRNIVNNALTHLGHDWMLNMDLKDFFHFVKEEDVHDLFSEPPFSFHKDLVQLLVMLTTYKKRLPMGAPSSPVLSNFGAKQLDMALQQIAQEKGWSYTRYADDMSFSTDGEIKVEEIDTLRECINALGFVVNEQKVHLFGPGEIKKITGLIVTENELMLPVEFIQTMDKEIARLGDVTTIQGQMGKERSKWVEDYKKRIGGMLEFAQYVLGENHTEYIRLQNSYTRASDPPEDFGSYAWLEFPYF